MAEGNSEIQQVAGRVEDLLETIKHVKAEHTVVNCHCYTHLCFSSC